MRIIRLKIVRFSRRSIDFVKRNLKAEFLKENNLWRYAIRCVQTAITRLTFRFTKILQNALIEIGVDEFESYRKGSRLASCRRLCRQP